MSWRSLRRFRPHPSRGTMRVLLSTLPVIAAVLIVQAAEPLPANWLDPTNPHYWANLLRAFAFLNGGLVVGMVVYTMARSVDAEQTVTGGHPRRLLYRHVTIIAAAHGLLILTLLFYVRDRINAPLSPGTPLSLLGMFATQYALALMMSYQNSRLRRFHSAKMVLGTVEPEKIDGRRTLCITPVGSTEHMSVDRWLDQFDTGELVRLTVEKVEEVGVAGRIWGRP